MRRTIALLTTISCISCARESAHDLPCDDAVALQRAMPGSVVMPAPDTAARTDPRDDRAHARDGAARWPEYTVHADSGWALIDGGLAEICGVRLEARDSTGRVVAYLTARRGTLDRASATVVASGDVLIELPAQRRTLRAEEVHWAPEEDRVWSPGPATLQDSATVLSGESFEADSRFETIHIRRARTRPAG